MHTGLHHVPPDARDQACIITAMTQSCMVMPQNMDQLQKVMMESSRVQYMQCLGYTYIIYSDHDSSWLHTKYRYKNNDGISAVCRSTSINNDTIEYKHEIQ